MSEPGAARQEYESWADLHNNGTPSTATWTNIVLETFRRADAALAEAERERDMGKTCNEQSEDNWKQAEAEEERLKFVVAELIDPGAYWGDWDSEEIMADIESRWAERGGGK